MAAFSYTNQLGLRFKALRVHHECGRIYREVDARTAASFVPGIRFDHYYPWLFHDDFRVGSAALRALAISNVLLSDAVQSRLRALRSGGVEADDAQAATHQSLIDHATDISDRIMGGDLLFREWRGQILQEQRVALETERQLVAGSRLLSARLLSDSEAEEHAARKAAYLKITILALGQLSGQTQKARIVVQAQEQLSIGLDLYNAFINWRNELCRYPINRVLMLARGHGANLASQDSLAHALYETDLNEQIFARMLAACQLAAGYDYTSHAFRQIVQWTTEKIHRLQLDLQALKR